MTVTNMDITSIHNLTRASAKAGGGHSHIRYDEKTEMFEDQYDEEDEENERFVMGASMPSNQVGMENRLLDELYQRKSFDHEDGRIRVGSQDEAKKYE